MIKLFDNDTEAEVGTISESQFDFLQEQLIEESLDASTYNLDTAAISSLEANGADRGLVTLLRGALGSRALTLAAASMTTSIL